MAGQHAHGPAAGGQMNVGILTCSDRGARGERADVSGPTIHNLVVDRLGGKVAQYKVVPDDRGAIEATLVEWVDEGRLDLIFTTGGTGFSPRDVTPEATRAVVDREAPALTQAMLFESLRITPYAMLTRATAGIRKRTLIVNLPGSPKALTENFEAVAEVLPHAVDIVRGVDTHAGGHGAHGGHGVGTGAATTATVATAEANGRDGHRHGGAGGHQSAAARAATPSMTSTSDTTPDSAPAAAAPARAMGPREGGLARNVGGPPC